MSSSKKGEHFEEIIKQIEEIKLPKNFKIKARERIYEDGFQLAEFDIDIQGEIDGAPVKWLFECRDRPSEKKSPTAWIEQLIGRKHLYNYSEVTAVSTTGFSEGAKIVAKKGSIGLRESSQITFEAVKSWINFSTVTIMTPIGKLIESNIFFDKTHLEKIEKFKNAKGPILFKKIGSKEEIGLSKLFDITLNNLFMTCPSKNWFKQEDLPIIFKIKGQLKNLWVVQIGACEIPVQFVTFKAEATAIQETKIPINKVLEYSEVGANQSIAQSVCFNHELNNEEITINFHCFPSIDKQDVFAVFSKKKVP